MEKYKRLETLVHLLGRKPYSTKQGLLDYFKDHLGVVLSTRTLERDFQCLETEFHIAVDYDRAHRGYCLLEEDNERITSFLTFAGRVYLAELFRKGLKDFHDLRKAIKLEDHSEFDGLDFIEPFFLAIQQKRIVHFVHENYVKNTWKNYQIVPLQLREYQGRWYVVGVPLTEKGHPEDHIKIFGLARVSKIAIGRPSEFFPEEQEVQLEKFSQIIGLNYDGGEQQEHIELAVSGNQYKYLASLPMHDSQQKLGELLDGRIKISLYLIPNYELKMQLLKLGDQVEVLRPEYLRVEIKTVLLNSLKRYQK